METIRKNPVASRTVLAGHDKHELFIDDTRPPRLYERSWFNHSCAGGYEDYRWSDRKVVKEAGYVDILKEHEVTPQKIRKIREKIESE